jgi:hypothetical protein
MELSSDSYNNDFVQNKLLEFSEAMIEELILICLNFYYIYFN